MVRTLICCAASLAFTVQSFSASIVMDGYYQGKDIYVKNPVGPKGVGFSVYEVLVNGEITSDEINSSAFIIDLHILGLEVGDKVTVTINHHDDSAPKILNSDAVLPQSTFEMITMNIDEKGRLSWKTKSEIGELPYKIQQFKWNKWITVGEVSGMGRMNENTYSFEADLHSGRNTFRVAQQTSEGKLRYSDPVHCESAKMVTLQTELKKVESEIQFSDNTHFEIYDAYGRMVKRGISNTVDVKKLQNGQYYLNYDMSFGISFEKK